MRDKRFVIINLALTLNYGLSAAGESGIYTRVQLPLNRVSLDTLFLVLELAHAPIDCRTVIYG